MAVTRLRDLDEAAAAAIARLLGVPLDRAPYRPRRQPVFCLLVPNQALGIHLELLLWTGLNRADVRIGDCTMVCKAIESIELYPGVEVLFRRSDPPGHLFVSVSGRAQMVV